jgi:hypothetical protein
MLHPHNPEAGVLSVTVGSPAATSAAPLPQPMLARSGSIPSRGDWSYEVKWDEFRVIVSTEGVPRWLSARLDGKGADSGGTPFPRRLAAVRRRGLLR